MVRTPKLLLAALAAACSGPAVEAAPDFEKQIAPILEGACLRCHKGEQKSLGGILVVENRLEPDPVDDKNGYKRLGVQAALGRTIPGEETWAGAEPVAVVSHRVWQSRFGADPFPEVTQFAVADAESRAGQHTGAAAFEKEGSKQFGHVDGRRVQ